MNKTIQKKLITESIRGWFVIDNILFDGKVDKYLKEGSVIRNKYNQLKKQYLMTVFEFYNKIGYKSSFINLPKTSKQIEKSANVIYEGLKKDFLKEFKLNQKKYCSYIAESIDPMNDKLIEERTKYFVNGMMLENFFIKKPVNSCRGNNTSLQEMKLIKECLKTVRDELLKISDKYFK